MACRGATTSPHHVAPRQKRRTKKQQGKQKKPPARVLALPAAVLRSGVLQAGFRRRALAMGLSFGVPGAVDGFEFALANHFEACHIGCGGGSVVN